ncbi:MAG: DUF3810 domain-containing protein [Bacteroidota bacterium]
MKNRLKNGIAISLIPQILLIKWLANHPVLIEKYYSEGIYPFISCFFRALLGWIPFSVGDLLYFSLFLLGAGYLYSKRRRIKMAPLSLFRDLIMILAVAYFTFHLLWGLNYYRQPITQKMGLSDTHTQKELVMVTRRFVQKTNRLQFAITQDTAECVNVPYSRREIFEKTVQGYKKLGKQLPFLDYNRKSIKKSLFSTALSYMGYGGYLNPFTQEAQVNGRLPKFRFPVVAGHEIGHQIGYSAEDETNLIGYLVTANSDDPYFQYTAAAYALGYCLSEIKRRDETLFTELYDQLNPGVQKNYREMSDFWKRYENPMEPIFKGIYDSFLKANNQEEGIQSYNSVVSLLVNYHRKNPL